MRNNKIEVWLPAYDKCIPMTMQTLAITGFQKGSVTLNPAPGGWYVTVATENLSGILMTDRKAPKRFASLDTAIRQLEEAGIYTATIRTTGRNT